MEHVSESITKSGVYGVSAGTFISSPKQLLSDAVWGFGRYQGWTWSTLTTFTKGILLVKQQLIEALVLALPKFGEVLIVDCDASHIGIDIAFSQ
ncbi:hypothetical protein Nepgr_019431 [Nepenthes gracilis]|uniref:Uncharacterized protein n=1 Tax=Nepenthes gracilis TaxID=150966 RepID=A0AAD3SV48_NEPGR|nr:hypothetical protein Nepgr_019431 [Nepenthes gracilis]